MYQCLLLLDGEGLYTSPWLACIRNICNECGMSGMCFFQNAPNTTWARKAVEQKLKDQWLVTCHNVQTRSLCSNYRMFKMVHGMEQYLGKLSKNDNH